MPAGSMPCSLSSFLLTNIASVLTQHLWLSKLIQNFVGDSKLWHESATAAAGMTSFGLNKENSSHVARSNANNLQAYCTRATFMMCQLITACPAWRGYRPSVGALLPECDESKDYCTTASLLSEKI